MINHFDSEKIHRINLLVDNTVKELKKEFIGIDEQIEKIMENVRTWMLTPSMDNRPIIINLWGMTGCGKTALIQSIIKHLNFRDSTIYFNFAELGDYKSYEIESEILDKMDGAQRMMASKNNNGIIFVYDEFQYGATLTPKGEEKDNRSALKPFWELLDTGHIKTNIPIADLSRLWRFVSAAEIATMMFEGVPLENGHLTTKHTEIALSLSAHEKKLLFYTFNFPVLEEPKKSKKMRKDEDDDAYPQQLSCQHYHGGYSYGNDEDDAIDERFRDKVFDKVDMAMSYSALRVIYNTIYKKVHPDMSMSDLFEKFAEFGTLTDIHDFLSVLFAQARETTDYNFSNCLIFVVGNLDEAYSVAFDTDPDMSPDQFHKITKNINLMDVKAALQKRFRNEQIARLGNIHITYPSFTSKTFHGIIDMELNKYAAKMKEYVKYDLVFDKKIRQFIYDEAVFPTHGTRPIFSTVQDVVKTKLPHVLCDLIDANIQDKATKCEYSYKRPCVVVTAYDKDEQILGIYKYREEGRLSKLRLASVDEHQALTAAHESGHFVVQMACNGKYPAKLVTKTVNSENGGFMLSDFDSRKIMSFNEYRNDIYVTLGGYIAEKLMFGEDNRTSGASADLMRATKIAACIIRRFGYKNPYVTTLAIDDEFPSMHSADMAVRSSEKEDKIIREILEDAEKHVTEILTSPSWWNMLVDSTKYLASHSQMPHKTMKQVYENNVPESKRTKPLTHFYRDVVNSLSKH